jgi:hypothetical protein
MFNVIANLNPNTSETLISKHIASVGFVYMLLGSLQVSCTYPGRPAIFSMSVRSREQLSGQTIDYVAMLFNPACMLSLCKFLRGRLQLFLGRLRFNIRGGLQNLDFGIRFDYLDVRRHDSRHILAAKR